MGSSFNLLVVLLYLTTLSHARRNEEFQFQCYGTRTLCTYPREFCSSNIKKCVECSKEVCSDLGDIPLACLNFCGGAVSDEQEQTSWLTPFICSTVSLFLTNCATLCLLLKCRRNRRSEKSDPASSSLLESKGMTQPSNAYDMTAPTDHYCEKKLKDVPPAQNPRGKYEPTTNHTRCMPTNECC